MMLQNGIMTTPILSRDTLPHPLIRSHQAGVLDGNIPLRLSVLHYHNDYCIGSVIVDPYQIVHSGKIVIQV